MGVKAVVASASFHLHNEEDDRHAHDREHVLEEEDEPVAEEANGLEVDGGPRHELAGLVPVVEAERETEELRVDLVPKVVLDPQCLPARSIADPP